jgi:hypothetical protein
MGQPKRKEKIAEASIPADLPPAKGRGVSGERWEKPQELTRRGWAIIAAIIALVQLPLIHYFLIRSPPKAVVSLPYSDDFSDPTTVAKNYWNSGGHWRVENGELVSPGVKNNPLWLRANLPPDVAVEFDVKSMSVEGDIKVEIFGDGTDHASGYVLIHGGWNNSKSIIARRDEHGPTYEALKQMAAVKARRENLPKNDVVATGVFQEDTGMTVEVPQHKPVEKGKVYHWRIERRGSLLRWLIDGNVYLEFDDPFPLTGKGHERFGPSSWDSHLIFDNLKVEAL